MRNYADFDATLFSVYIKFFGHKMVTVLHQKPQYQGRVNQGLGVYFQEQQKKFYSNFKSAFYNWKLVRCDKKVAFTYDKN